MDERMARERSTVGEFATVAALKRMLHEVLAKASPMAAKGCAVAARIERETLEDLRALGEAV